MPLSTYLRRSSHATPFAASINGHQRRSKPIRNDQDRQKASVISALNLHPLRRELRRAVKREYRRLLDRPIYSRDTTTLVARANRPTMFCSLGKLAVLITWNPLFCILSWRIQLRLKKNAFLPNLNSSVLS